MDIFSNLFYNPLMKRFILTIALLLATATCANAISFTKEPTQFIQKEEFQSITNEANVFYAENNIKEAERLLLTIPDDERSPQNWLLLGNILQDQGKINEAIFMYKLASETDPKYYKAYYNLGNIYLQEGKINMAIEEYKKTIKYKSDYPYAHYNLACAYIKQEKYSKAKFELYNALDLKNTVPEFHYNLAFVLKKLGKEKDAKTYLEHYNKLMENNYGNNF